MLYILISKGKNYISMKFGFCRLDFPAALANVMHSLTK